MLNKDQYNEDQYNDYYAQATRDAEIRYKGDGEGGAKKILLILLLLLLIGAGIYFVLQNLGSDAGSETPQLEAAAQESSAAPVSAAPAADSDNTAAATPSTEMMQKVAATVQNGDGNANLSQEQLNQIAQMIVAEMNKQKGQANSSASTPSAQPAAQDTTLMNTLSEAELDTLATPDSLEPISESDSQKQAAIGKEVDTYNKVVVGTESSDMLDQLADVIDDGGAAAEGSNYTQSITQEVTVREKEMRVWVVQKGDTLGKIAKEVYGNVMDYKKIYEANPDILRRPDKIYVGQKLRIPK